MNIVSVEVGEPLFERFVMFPWQIYGDKHAWVPPLKEGVAADFVRHSNLFFRHGDAQAFLCMDGENALGRIVASYDDSLFGMRNCGNFGYFECIDDERVAHLLLEAAGSWLQERGKHTVYGPMNFNVFRNYRLQIDGFDRPPFLGEPRAPAYYRALIEKAGYQVDEVWRSWDMDASLFSLMRHSMQQKLSQYDSEWLASLKLSFFRPQTFADDCRRIHSLMLDVFRDNFAFPDIDVDEYVQVQSSAQFLCNGYSAMIETAENEPIAFFWGYYDYSEAFVEMNGDSERLDCVAKHTPKRAVFNAFGARSEHRGKGIAYYILEYAVARVIEVGSHHAVAAMIKEGKSAFDVLGPANRRYAMYRKQLV